jgi:hypothetical protein
VEERLVGQRKSGGKLVGGNVLELGDGTKAPGISSVPTSSIKDNGKRVTWNECGVPTAGGFAGATDL